jgi:hypothetical protein
MEREYRELAGTLKSESPRGRKRIGFSLAEERPVAEPELGRRVAAGAAIGKSSPPPPED